MNEFKTFIDSSDFLVSAQLFSRCAHDAVNQKRKYTGEPYWVHTDRVAELVYKFCAPHGDIIHINEVEEMIKAAFAHDIGEDVTPLLPEFYSASKIENALGKEAAFLVVELTDVFTKDAYPKFNRAIRKDLEAKRMANISDKAKIIKCCDIIDNTKDICFNDRNFARVYLREKDVLLKYMLEGVDNSKYARIFSHIKLVLKEQEHERGN